LVAFIFVEMKNTTFFILCITTVSVAYTQDRTVKELQVAGTRPIKSLDSNGWQLTGTFLLNLNQGALSNWVSGGEERVLGINAHFNYAINFRHGKNTWDNYFDLALGFQNATSFGSFRKIDDRIDVTGKYGHLINHHWYLGVLTNFNSQSLAGYDYNAKGAEKISGFLTPGKITLSPGMDYKTATRFSLFTSPITVRWVTKEDDDLLNVSKFGVDSARRSNTELGAFVTAKYKAAFTKWATYTGRVDLFSNYKREPQNVDVLMNNLLTMKFTRVLATSLSLDLVYDDDLKKRLQLKEILGIGLTVKL
jgi:hypothetical protein